MAFAQAGELVGDNKSLAGTDRLFVLGATMPQNEESLVTIYLPKGTLSSQSGTENSLDNCALSEHAREQSVTASH